MGYTQKVGAIREEVELTAGYKAWVGLLDKAGNDAVQAALLGGSKSQGKFVTEGDGPHATQRSEFDQSLDNAAYTDTLLLHGIKDWTLDDDAGNTLPITLQTVRLLAGPDADRCVLAIKEVNKGPDRAEKSALNGAGHADPEKRVRSLAR